MVILYVAKTMRLTSFRFRIKAFYLFNPSQVASVGGIKTTSATGINPSLERSLNKE